MHKIYSTLSSRCTQLIEKVTYEQCQANDSGERATNFECVFYEALHNLYNLVNI